MERDLNARGSLGLRNLGIGGRATEVLRRIKQSLKASGLEKRLDLPTLLAGLTLDDTLTLRVPGPCDSYLAAALAEAVRQELLDEGQTFTFETVMSHPSKIEFMEEARARGYRVYLYFVATDDPDINIDRVHRRVLQGGHPVADEKVVERYHRSIGLMTRACAVAHRAYIFDNSGSKHKLLAEVTDFDTIRLADLLLKLRRELPDPVPNAAHGGGLPWSTIHLGALPAAALVGWNPALTRRGHQGAG